MRTAEQIVEDELGWKTRHKDDPGPTPQECIDAVGKALTEGRRAGLEEAAKEVARFEKEKWQKMFSGERALGGFAVHTLMANIRALMEPRT